MQHYLQAGLGFSAQHLTAEEFSRLSEFYQYEHKQGEIALAVIAFGEEVGGKDWATVVVYTTGTVGQSGKLITSAQAQDNLAALRKVLIERTDEISTVLSSHGLGHLSTLVEPVFYTESY